MKNIIIIIAIMFTACFVDAGEKISNVSGKEKRKELKKIKTEIEFVTKAKNVTDMALAPDLEYYLLQQQIVTDALVKQTTKE